MMQARPTLIGRLGRGADRLLSRLDVLALFPLVALSALALGLGDLVTVTAFALPALLALRALARPPAEGWTDGAGHGALPGTPSARTGREAVLAALERAAGVEGHDSACILLQIDGWEDLSDRWGAEAAEELARRCGDRLATAVRRDDLVVRLGDARFAVVLHPIPAARLGTREAIADRLRGVIAEAIAIDGTAVRLTASAGHANLQRDIGDVAETTLAAAEAALAEAHRNGPNAMRAYTPGLLTRRRAEADLAGEVEGALAEGEIRPWFQPQIRLATGRISGFEALARWHHPVRGTLAPAEFLPAVDSAGRMDVLGQCILDHALAALATWDEAGLSIPSVSVNFSAGELRAPGLAEQVADALLRHGLAPDRLTVEILETVAAQGADDRIIATIAALRRHGVRLDLDDFGIGQASLSAIRRFGVSRIKIDRSFILGLDTDEGQRAMVAAVLSMARHLGVETLAEGVETQAVRDALARMGCDHLQGFHLARPMPFDATLGWARRHAARAAVPPRIACRAG